MRLCLAAILGLILGTVTGAPQEKHRSLQTTPLKLGSGAAATQEKHKAVLTQEISRERRYCLLTTNSKYPQLGVSSPQFGI